MNTPRRTIRIDDDLWNAATEQAAKEETTVTAIVRRLLSSYVRTAAVVLAAVFALSACGDAEQPVAERSAAPGTSVAPSAGEPSAEPTATCWAALPFEDPNSWQQRWNTLGTEATLDLAVDVLESLPDPSEGCTATDRAELANAKDLLADVRESIKAGQS